MNRPLIKIAAFTLVLLPGKMALAYTVDEALALLATGRPSIEAETISARASVEELKADASLPGPEVTFSHQWGLDGAGTKLNAGVSQSFDWPGVYATRRKAVREAKNALERIEAARVNELAGNLRDLLVEYIGARRSHAALAETDAMLARLDSLTRRAYAAGEVTILDVNKLTIARADLGHELHVAATRIEDLEGQISEMSETDSRTVLAELIDIYPTLTVPDEDTYMASVAANDPEVISNSSEGRAAELTAIAEKRSLYPGFSVGYDFSREEGETFHGFSIGVTLPSASSTHRAAAARLRAQAAATAAIGLEATRRAQYNALVANARQLDDEIRRLGAVFDKCDNLRLLEKAYAGGQLSMLEFIQEMDYFARARLSYIEDVSQYHLILSKLNRYIF